IRIHISRRLASITGGHGVLVVTDQPFDIFPRILGRIRRSGNPGGTEGSWVAQAIVESSVRSGLILPRNDVIEGWKILSGGHPDRGSADVGLFFEVSLDGFRYSRSARVRGQIRNALPALLRLLRRLLRPLPGVLIDWSACC